MTPRDRPATLLLATGNAGKVREFQALLGGLRCELRSLAELPTFDEPIESGDTLAANARIKAAHAARRAGEWALADDTGLFVDALDGAPAVRTARFAGEHATAADNRTLLLAKLVSVPTPQRTARFECALALADPRGEIVLESHGVCRGRIRSAVAGEGGFGYDPLFELLEYRQTFAELGTAAKNRLSHRARAVERLTAAWQRLW